MAYASALDRQMARLVMKKSGPGGRFVRTFLTLFGIEVPRTVRIGKDLKLPHATTGFVIHPNVTIGNRVTIFHGVTIGRANVWEAADPDNWGGADIEDDAVPCAGAAVLIRDGSRIRVGQGSVIGARPWSKAQSRRTPGRTASWPSRTAPSPR